MLNTILIHEIFFFLVYIEALFKVYIQIKFDMITSVSFYTYKNMRAYMYVQSVCVNECLRMEGQ